MPDMTGAEVAEAIRAMKPDLPLLMLSGFTDSVPKEALQIIQALITKGGPPEDLLAILKDALQGNSATVCTILNVDDNPQHRYALTRALRKAGFTVIEASNGWEAIAKASARPDIILLDINLPDLSGFEVCRRLKADPVTRSIPIIQISASHDSESAESESLRAGAEMFMEQPQDLAVVVQVVRNQIARHYPPVH
jgi:CheY-like chemotaxis protein